MLVRKGKKQHKLTPCLNICHSNNQSILQPLQEGSTFMGFAQSDGLTGCYRFTALPQMSIPPLLGCVTRKKKKIHWSRRSVSRWLSCSVPQQLETPVGTPPRNVRQPIHGPVGHLSAADNGFWRRIFTDLWPPLRRTAHKPPRAQMRVHMH